MKVSKLLVMSVIALGLTACGSKKSEKETTSIVMTPETTEISGPLEGCYTVVDREYKATEGSLSKVTIELERTDKAFPFDENFGEFDSMGSSSRDPKIKMGFGIEFLDEDGNVIDTQEASRGTSNEIKALGKLAPGGKASIQFSMPDSFMNESVNQIVSFRITSNYETDKGWGESSSESDNSTVSESEDDSSDIASSDEDFDEFLKSYENYVDKYIALMKKAKNGDATAIAEAASLYSDAQEYAEKLQKISGNLTASQLAKFQKLQQKLISAAN